MLQQKLVLLAVFFICHSLVACVSDVANRYYLDETFVARHPSEVEILDSKPSRDFIVIADFQARGKSRNSLRNSAAAIGADAVIVSNLGGTYSRSESWAGDDRFSGSGNRIVGTAIKYKD